MAAPSRLSVTVGPPAEPAIVDELPEYGARRSPEENRRAAWPEPTWTPDRASPKLARSTRRTKACARARHDDQGSGNRGGESTPARA